MLEELMSGRLQAGALVEDGTEKSFHHTNAEDCK